MPFDLTDDNIKGKISAVLSEQLPEFVRSDHPTFVTFLEAYYEWLEIHGNAVETTRNAKVYNDIDLTVDTFVDYFKKNYLVDIPDSIINDKRNLLKNIKDHVLQCVNNPYKCVLILDCSAGGFPPIFQIGKMVNFLIDSKSILKEGLDFSIVYSKSSNYKSWVDMVLQMYTPVRPMHIARSSEDVKNFLSKRNYEKWL